MANERARYLCRRLNGVRIKCILTVVICARRDLYAAPRRRRLSKPLDERLNSWFVSSASL